MFVRVVRFEDVSAERIADIASQVEDSDGPPPGVTMSELKVIVDADQGTAVVMQFFATAEDMAEGEAVFDAMDPSETPGRRASVDRGEIRFEWSTSG